MIKKKSSNVADLLSCKNDLKESSSSSETVSGQEADLFEKSSYSNISDRLYEKVC